MRLHRRELLIAGAGALAAKATASVVACAADPVDGKKPDTKAEKADAKEDTKMDEHEGHAGHEGHEGHGDVPATAADAGVDTALVNTIGDCISAGRVCLSHCLRLLGSGDTSMADCSKAVTDMLAICQASESLAAANSKHLKALAKVCIDGCTDCAKACTPHVGHHPECKACKEACDATIEAMKAV
jgi:Cys-rich four helix bundle protein (predicted Tat secretion target)